MSERPIKGRWHGCVIEHDRTVQQILAICFIVCWTLEKIVYIVLLPTCLRIHAAAQSRCTTHALEVSLHFRAFDCAIVEITISSFCNLLEPRPD